MTPAIRELFALVKAAGLTVTLDGEPVTSPDDARFVGRVGQAVERRLADALAREDARRRAEDAK